MPWKQRGATKLFFDQISGTVAKRPGREKAKEHLRKGDALVVWRLDRQGRSLRDLIDWASWLEGQGIGLVSLQENIDTTTPTGKLVFHMFGALAEFERNLIQERAMSGLKAARARGKKGGRAKALKEKEQTALVTLYNAKDHTDQVTQLPNCVPCTAFQNQHSINM